MLTRLKSHSARLLPQAMLGQLGWLRGALGATLGIGLAALISALALGPFHPALPLLVAPMGASAVLVFALPASPMAQPWPVLAGDLVSAAVGLALGHLIGSPALAGAVAVGAAIAVMSLTRSLHPPGGACALLCALGAAGPDHWGWPYLALFAVNVGALCAAGWLYNNATGHAWPHRLAVPAAPTAANELTHAHVEAVLAEWDEVLDVDVDDLVALVQAVDRQRGR